MGPSARKLLSIACILAALGCGESRVAPPPLDTASAAQGAFDKYDSNKDGQLDRKELEGSPPLFAALTLLDKDGDGKLSLDELQTHLKEVQDSKIGLMERSFKVLLDEQPLAGATVTLVPEEFLGGEVKQATGVTDEAGSVSPTVAGSKYPGLSCGFYRVQISKSNAGGEMVPARYNTNTTLGVEVGPDDRNQSAVFRLTTR